MSVVSLVVSLVVVAAVGLGHTLVEAGTGRVPEPSPRQPDRAALGPTAAPSTTPPPNSGAASAGKPSAGTTGVPAGTALTQKYGDITVTRAGTVLSNLDIHGFVTVRAANVTIKNSIVRGGRASGNVGIITNYGYPNLRISDVDVRPEFPSVWLDGIKGWSFTADRVHVVGGVDSVKIHGDDVTIKNSLLEDTNYFASDPNQGGAATHNDNIQVLKGHNLNISGNTIRGATNFAVLGAAEQGGVTMSVTNNSVDGGWCTVKLQARNGQVNRATVTGNRFGPHRRVQSCPFQATPAVSLDQADNTFEQTGAPVTALRLDG